MAIESYKDLTVWQKSMDLVIKIYQLTHVLPVDERFGLISQMRRAAVSVSSNIAEGHRRNSRKDYAKFVSYAFGSGSELETQLEIVDRLGYVPGQSVTETRLLLTEVMKMLNVLVNKLDEQPYTQQPTTHPL